MMNRREIIKGLTLSLGYAVAAPTVLSVLESCSIKTKTWTALWFNEKEQHFVSHLVDIIFPKTDTPGGLEVNLPQFIDMMSNDMYSPEEKDIYKEGSGIFAQKFSQEFGKDIGTSTRDEVARLFASFFDKSPEEQMKIKSMQSKPIDQIKEEERDLYTMYKFLLNIRGLALLGYFTSEKVGKEVLNFDPIPGRYEPCVPVSEIGNAWTI